jgi:hypothetical protein
MTRVCKRCGHRPVPRNSIPGREEPQQPCFRCGGEIVFRGRSIFTPPWLEKAGEVVGAVIGIALVLLVIGGIAYGVVADAVDGSQDGAGGRPSFCNTHDCIPTFYDGQGSIVQCVDGEWSHSGGIQGACSYHGGVR